MNESGGVKRIPGVKEGSGDFFGFFFLAGFCCGEIMGGFLFHVEQGGRGIIQRVAPLASFLIRFHNRHHN